MGFTAGNAQHIGARPQQQDAFGFSDPSEHEFAVHGGFLGVVADGVGGLTHGSEASQSAVRAFLQAYHLKSPAESIPDALVRSLHEANAAVLRVASEPSAEGAGTTLVAAVLRDQSLYWISAGDSRIYLLHAGRLTRVTSDHTYARELDEQAAQGKISRAEAQNDSERGALTSYLGQPEPKKVDKSARPLALQPDDSVILCSDGFYRALDDTEMVTAFHHDLQKACDMLVRRVVAKQRKGQDNLTVIALKQSGGSRRLWPQEKEGRRTRLLVFASALVILALLYAGTVYWNETHPGSEPASVPQDQQQQTATPAGNPGNSSGGADASATQVETPPHTDTKSSAAKPDKPVQGQPQKKKAKKNANTKTAPPAGTVHKTSNGAPQPTPAPGQGAPESSPGPPAQPSGAGATPAAPAADSEEKKPASEPVPGGDPEKPPASPPPATPDGPPNLVFGGGTDTTLRSHYEDDFRDRWFNCGLGIKDGERSCHS
jgi:serine/threonine protein phosphatase PrpC